MKPSFSLPCLPGIHRVTPPYGRGRINAIFGKKLDKNSIKTSLTESGQLEHSLSTHSTLTRNLSNTLSRSSLPSGAPERERLELLSSSSIGSLLPMQGPSRIPAFVSMDKKVLDFTAYYKEPVFESQVETWRNRKLVISYYLEDHTISIVEQKEDNTGLMGGPFLERARHIVNPGTFERYLEIQDLIPGNEIKLYNRQYHICAASKWTRDYMTNELGVDMSMYPDKGYPSDKYTDERKIFMSRETGCDPDVDRGKPMYPMKRYNEALLGKHTRATGQEHRNHLYNGQLLEFTLGKYLYQRKQDKKATIETCIVFLYTLLIVNMKFTDNSFFFSSFFVAVFYHTFVFFFLCTVNYSIISYKQQQYGKVAIVCMDINMSTK